MGILPKAIALAAEEKIIIFCLPTHTAHVAQSLDVSFLAHLNSIGQRCAMIIWLIILEE